MATTKRTTRSKTPTAARTAPEVDELLARARHPLEKDLQRLRRVMASADPSIREEVKWSSVSFRNEHDFFATVNLRSTDAVQLILHTGVKKKATAVSGVQVDDPGGLIEKWAAKDRCVVTLGRGAALKKNEAAFSELIKEWLRFVKSA